MMSPVTRETAKAALCHIPPNLPRDEWARVGMAIKSEFPDDDGLAMFDQWSAGADGYRHADVVSTWRSVKGEGGIGIGTMLHMAKVNGFRLEPGAVPAAPSAAEQATHARQRAQRQRDEAGRREQAHEAAAVKACEMWAAAKDEGASAYLERKRVALHGVRVDARGWLLVPLRDGAGKLWNVQQIAPARSRFKGGSAPEAIGTDKLFLKGGLKSGLWHMCGVATDCAELLIAEGYATAASLHEATGKPVAVAFDAGNLMHVAKALRALHPAAQLVVCGDDDAGTQANTGRNPGREKAAATAAAVRGVAVFPPLPALAEGEAPENFDWNDLHIRSGLEGVCASYGAALPQLFGAPAAKPFDRFLVDHEGVWVTPPGDESGSPRKVCGPLRVTGLARDAHDNQAALVLEFDTPFRKGRVWLMPLAMLSGDGAAYRAALLSQGFMTPSDTKRRGWLTEYLQSRAPDELVKHVPRVGWYGPCYVLPHETLGKSLSGDRLMFHSEAGVEANFSQRGTLDQWRDGLSRVCVGNTRAVFAVSAALAGPLLVWAPGTSGGGFHFKGPTSIGKTTGLLIAASVWGKGTEKDPESYVQKWRATSSGLEYQGEQHNDCTLILDELGQVDPNEAGAAAYMLADGMGKTRGKGAGGLRAKPTWRLLFLSSGELTLAQHMETAGKTMKGGQEVRLIPIPAEVVPGSALENLHEFAGGHELSGWVQQQAARVYGTAGRAWLEHLVAHTNGLAAELRARMDAIELQMVPETAAGQVKRGGRRFALVAAAGEMATAVGLTGWPAGEATRAALACFNAWVQTRGGSGSSEVNAMLRAVRRFMEQHGEGRFSWWHRAADDHSPKTMNRAGVRRLLNRDGEPIRSNNQHLAEYGERMPEQRGDETSTEYFVLADVFRQEVCTGFDHLAVCEVLLERGCLVPDKGRKHDTKQRLPGIGLTWCYRIAPAIFELDV